MTMTTTELHLTKSGVVRRRYALARADGEALGTIDLGPQRGAWTDPDGTTWEAWTDLQSWISTTGDGRRIEAGVRDDGRYLRVGGRRFRMAFDRHGGRSARLRPADDDRVVLEAAVAESRGGGPFRVIRAGDDLPEPLAVAAHVGFMIAYSYEELRLVAGRSGGGSGPAN
jgi:hypothetical protein